MKRIFTLLWLTITAFTFKANAQTGCNAEFSTQFLNYNTVKFNPVTNVGAPIVTHLWNFGDGTAVNQAVSPTHVYNLPGAYPVVHTVVLHDSSGTPVCTNSFTVLVTITQPCNLVVDFSWTFAPTNPLTVAFQNLSVPLSTTDSITWQFGDNTLSHDVNPVHTYANAGTYNVCLIVKKNNGANTTPCINYICKTVVVQTACNLIADFSWTISQTNSVSVEFHNLTTPIATNDSIRWTFGDGSTSSAYSPTHIYNAPGTYTVCLRVIRYNAGSTTPCIREICKTVVIPQPCNFVVDFNWTVTQTNPLRIEFHNLTTPIATNDSIRWTFGDGSMSSDINPIHTYNLPGTYTVCLRVIRYNSNTTTPCIREICKTVIVSQPCNLVVDFSWTVTQTNPLRIEFHNLTTPSSPTDSTIWSFGDGTSSLDANPVHTYGQAGTYTVCLTVRKFPYTVSTPCVRYICKTVVVPPPCNLIVNFNWHLDSLNNRKVYFTNLTNAPTATSTATWSFGDGTTATSWNAIHEYTQPGTYIVCLHVTAGPNSNCAGDKCDTVYIPNPVPPCTELSRFHFAKSPTNNQEYKFTPDYLNTALQYTWTFGDGTGSHDPISIHQYANPGIYTACLTAWRGPGCASTTCHEIRVEQQVNCDTTHVTYTYQPNPTVPNKIQFYAHCSLPLLDQTWTITKVNGTVTTPPVILHQNNPNYLFQDTGLFRVCLRAVVLGGCVREYCNYIHIATVANACVLQAFPNPTSGTVNVNLYLTQPETIHILIYNSLNVLVLDSQQQGFTGNNLVTLNVSNLTAGQYTIKLIYGTHVCYSTFQKL